MQRHRDIAGSPVRTIAEVWNAIADLVEATLDKSPYIEASEVRQAFASTNSVGRALIAGSYLEREPLTLVAGSLTLTIKIIGGEGAFRAVDEENLNPVPGGAASTEWKVHLPRPDGLADLIDQGIAGIDSFSTEKPTESKEAQSVSVGASVDLTRLDPANRRNE